MDAYKRLEAITNEVMDAFDVHAPPVPVETMLQQPPESMWETVDVNQLSGTFLSIKDRFSPRMSLARLLARHIAKSAWGQARGVPELIGQDEDTIRAFARMLVMPEEMVSSMTSSARNPTVMSLEFEVPEDDARQRLAEMV
jgi:hypothetical protein